MYNKLLTVSVAAYNVEKFIENTLQSLSDERYVDKLEVFVVDDGGQDKSLEIAKSFEGRFPNTFHAVHKENGGYGSTVNYSIAHATGKYFKLLDGDDWFDQDGLATVLERLENYEEDVIITDYYMGPSKESLTIIPMRNEDDQVVKVSEYKTNFPHGMWTIFYRTVILKESRVELPQHTLYTDQIYSTIPFSFANTIRFVNIPVYCYRYGREDQSTSKSSRVKHADEMLRVCKTILDYYKENKLEGNSYLYSRVVRYYIVAVRTLLLLPYNKANLTKLKEFEEQSRKEYPDIYNAAIESEKMGKLIHFLRLSHYFAYWGLRFIPDSVLNR